MICVTEVKEIDGDGGKKRQVKGNGLFFLEDSLTSPVFFYRAAYGNEKITKLMRVSFLAKECMEGQIADFVKACRRLV